MISTESRDSARWVFWYWLGPLMHLSSAGQLWAFSCIGVCVCSVASSVSDSVRPHRWQPIRLLCSWDSPGKNTGVGCHFLLNACMHAKSLQSCLTLCDPMDYSPPGSSVHGDSPGKNTGVGCHALLHGILPTQRLNLHLLHLVHCRRILYR